RRAELPKVGHMDAGRMEELESPALTGTPFGKGEVPEVNEQPLGYEEDEWNAVDYAALAINRL
ncbi:MAG: hypothetical protein IKN32_10150, partial [Bacteroidales bacterium]|nr:hypothetical protein [Bacteroidales bacterium]